MGLYRILKKFGSLLWKFLIFFLSSMGLMMFFSFNITYTIFVVVLLYVYSYSCLLAKKISQNKVGLFLKQRNFFWYFKSFIKWFYRYVGFQIILSFEKLFFSFSIQLCIFKWVIRMWIIWRLLFFFFYKTWKWAENVFYKGKFESFWTFSKTSSFIIYLYFFYVIIAFYLLFFFILANLYIYCLLFCLFCVVLYFVCVSFQKGFSILFNYTYFYFFEAIEIFVVLLNVLNIYLTSLFFQITKYTLLSEKKESKITGNKFSLLLLLLNLNNVRFLTFIDHYTQELKKIPGFHSLSLSNKRINSSGSLIFSSSDGLLNALLSNLYNSPRSLSTSKVEASFILELLNWFVSPENFNNLINLRKIMQQTSDKGDSSEIQHKIMLKHNIKASNRAFDLLVNTNWLNMAEPVLINNLVSEEEKKLYKVQFKRPIKLIYSFFKEGTLPFVFWSTIFFFIKHQRFLKMNREYVVKTSNNFFKNRFEKSFDRSNLVVRQVKMSDKQEVIQWPKDNMSNSFGFFSFKLPLIFSFLSQLNYVLFLLMGELFGSFFYNISNFSYNFFQILRYFETVDLSWKGSWLIKVIIFCLVDIWKFFFKVFFSSYFFLKYVVFGGKLFTFFITYSLQVLLYFVQYVHVNNVSFIRSLLYTEKYRDFFLYKFDIVRSEGSYVLVYFLGYVGILIEKLFFLFFFIFFMVYDFCIVVFYKLLWNKYFFKCLFFLWHAVKNTCFEVLVKLFLPLCEFFVFCNYIDKLSKEFYKQSSLQNGKIVGFKNHYRYLSPIENWMVNFFIWKYFVKKYWWNISIKHETGLKKIPFFFKFSKKFFWFDRIYLVVEKSRILVKWVWFLFYNRFIMKICSSLKFVFMSFFYLPINFFVFYICYFFINLVLIGLKVIVPFLFAFPKREDALQQRFYQYQKKKQEGLNSLSKLKWNLIQRNFFFRHQTQDIVPCLEELSRQNQTDIIQGSAQKVLCALYLSDMKNTVSPKFKRDRSNNFIDTMGFYYIFYKNKTNDICFNRKSLGVGLRYKVLKENSSKLNTLKKNVFSKNLDIVFFGKFCLFFVERVKVLGLANDSFIKRDQGEEIKKTSNFFNQFVSQFDHVFLNKRRSALLWVLIRKLYNTRNIEEENNGIFDILSIDRVKNTFSVYTDLISCVLLKGLISNPVNLVSSKSCFLNAKRTKVFFFEKLLVQYFLDFFFSHYKQLIYLFEKKIWSIFSVSVFEKKINYDIGLFKKAKKEGNVNLNADLNLLSTFNKVGVFLWTYIFRYLFVLSPSVFYNSFYKLFQIFVLDSFVNLDLLDKNTTKYFVVFQKSMLDFYLNISVQYYFKKYVEHITNSYLLKILLRDQKETSLYSISKYFVKEYSVLSKRYWVYIYDFVLTDLAKLIKTIDLSLRGTVTSEENVAGSSSFHSLYEEEQMLSNFLEEKASSAKKQNKNQQKTLKSLRRFQISRMLPRRVKNIFVHNLYWIEKFSSVSLELNPLRDERVFNSQQKNSFVFKGRPVHDLTVDFFFLMYRWYSFKWNAFLLYWHIRYFFYTIGFFGNFWSIFGLLLFFFGIVNIISLKFWVILFSWVYSVLKYIIVILGSLFISVLSNLDLTSGNLFREFYEAFFYYYVLQSLSYDVLVTLDLYSVFLFCLNHIGLHEEAGWNFLRGLWMFQTTVLVFVSKIYFECITYTILLFWILLKWGVTLGSFCFIDSSVMNEIFRLVCVDICVYIFNFWDFILYNMYLSVLWQSVIFIYYGFNAFLLYFFYFYVSFELLVLNIVDIVCYFLNYKFLICYIDLCVCMEDYGIFMDCTKSLIFFIKTQIDFILDVVSVLYFMIQLYLMYILKFFITCFWTLIYFVLCIADCLLTMFSWIVDSIYLLKNLFFEDVILTDVVLYIGQIMVWFYLNAIYYVILVPFFYFIYGIYCLIKFVIFLPLFLITCVKSVVIFIVKVLWWCSSFIFNVFVDAVLWFWVYPVNEFFYPMIEFIASFYLWIMDKFEAYSLLSGVVYVVWELFCVVVLFLIAPVFTMYTICLHCAYFLIFPVIFIFKTASYCGFVFIKYMPFFYLILKEFSLLLITIFLCYFKFLVVVWNGFFYMIDIFIAVIDELFPTLKNALDPIGGLSIFYATLYYYIFMWCCILWSYSYRIFNDTCKDPLIPEQAWFKNVDLFESHPVYQRLPLDVYTLLFSERLCSDEVNMPLELRQSLEVWMPVEEIVEFPQMRIRETPLNLQGYYYMILNDMVKKHVIQYYKNKFYISWFLKGSLFEPIINVVWNEVGFAKTKNAFWETYADFYEKKITEEEVQEMIDPSFELMKNKSKFEEMTSFGQFWDHTELWFRDESRRRRAVNLQLEERELYEQFGYGTREFVRNLPVLGKWFGHQRVRDFKRDYKIAVFKVSVQRGYEHKLLSESQKTAKRQFLIEWLKYNDMNKRYEYHSLPQARNVPLKGGFALNELIKRDLKTLNSEDNLPFDPESFVVKKYRKMPKRDDEMQSPEFALDPLFIGLRFLDLLLYPILVFATVNTGWWYSMNGMMDSLYRYMTLEEYAENMAKVFLQHVENHNVIQKNIENAKFSTAILQLYDSQQFISDYLPANQDIFDKFLLEYPELYNNNFIAENPISFLKNLYTYINTNEKGEEWLIDLYERSKITDESLNNIILKEETDFIPSRSTAVDTSLVDKKVLGFLENTYDSRFLAEIFDHLEKRGENRPGLLHAQIFNKSEEIPKAGPRVSFNPIYIVKDIMKDLFGVNSEVNYISEEKDIIEFVTAHNNVVDNNNLKTGKTDAVNIIDHVTLMDLTKNIHPLESEERQRLLRLRYHIFPQMELHEGFWSENYWTIQKFLQSNFVISDSPQDFVFYLEQLPVIYRNVLNKENVNPELLFLSEQISDITRFYNIPIVRQSNFPWRDDLWKEVIDFELSLRSLDDIRNSIFNWQSYWLKYVKNHKLMELSTIAHEMGEEILYGDMLYQYYTSGFLGLIHKTSIQKLLWLWFKVYEDTFFGRIMFEILRHGLLRRYSTGIEVSPYLLKEIDPMVGLIGVSPFLTISDFKYLKSDLFNMYTNFSAYSHFGPLMLQRMALLYFQRPDLFDDSWFNEMVSENFYIAADVLMDHAQHASYYYPVLYATQATEDRVLILKWMLMEKGKQFKMFVSLVNKQILKALYDIGQYGLSFQVIHSFYTVVAEPLMGLYGFTQDTVLMLQTTFLKFKTIFQYIFVDLRLFNRIKGLLVLVTIPVRYWGGFVFNMLKENLNNIFFFLNKESLDQLGLSVWWQYSIIRGGFLMAYDFVQFLFMFFDDWKFNYELIFFYQKWPKDFMETLWRESWAAFFLVLLEGYWINFNDRLGFVLLLSSLKDFSWTSFLYSFNLTIALNAFWITAPFVTPWFWFNFVLFFVEKFKLDEIYWAWFLFNHYDAFRLEWSLGAFEDINSILLHESIIQIASTGRGEDHPINFRDLISKDEFNNYVNNYFFLQLSELKPVLGRESSEAPFSFLSPNGLIVYSLNEVMFLSDIFMARQFKKDLYYAVDFFKIYNKDKNSDDLFVWLDYVPYAENKKYPYKSLSANDYLVPKFTFLTEIGPDFYLNLRKYEESFSLPYFRYFFHRYQELVTHVLSKGSVFEKELSETVLERKYLYGGVSHVIIAYDPSKESNVVLTLDGKGKRAVVVQDIYGNIIYFNVYRRKF